MPQRSPLDSLQYSSRNQFIVNEDCCSSTLHVKKARSDRRHSPINPNKIIGHGSSSLTMTELNDLEGDITCHPHYFPEQMLFVLWHLHLENLRYCYLIFLGYLLFLGQPALKCLLLELFKICFFNVLQKRKKKSFWYSVLPRSWPLKISILFFRLVCLFLLNC